jgi:hypothetical protein
MGKLKWYGPMVTEKVMSAVKAGINETMAACVVKAKKRVRLDTTLLQGSIQIIPAVKRGDEIVGEWGAVNNKYAAAMELGADPHFPPVDMLKPWARRKLGDEDAAWPVAVTISILGTEPHPFLRPAADEEYPKLKRRIKEHYVG